MTKEFEQWWREQTVGYGATHAKFPASAWGAVKVIAWLAWQGGRASVKHEGCVRLAEGPIVSVGRLEMKEVPE